MSTGKQQRARHLERIFLHLTVPTDRERIKNFIGVVVTLSVMRRSIAQNLIISSGALLTLLLIYLIV